MEFTLFPDFETLFLALASGLIFGFLLRKAAVTRFNTIVGQFLLKDFTVMKVILTAIIIGGFGIYSASFFDLLPKFLLSETPVLLSIIGGGIFGIGMSIAGFCPGTGIAALADGSKEMVWGLLGMIAGSLLFNELSEIIMPYLSLKDALFKETLATHFSLTYPLVLLLLGVLWTGFYLAMRWVDSKKTNTQPYRDQACKTLS